MILDWLVPRKGRGLCPGNWKRVITQQFSSHVVKDPRIVAFYNASSHRVTACPMTKPRVLVVGSGLAGLTSAYLLRKEGCEVWLVEKVRRAMLLK
jgi:NADPH-dependent 2,4-dienoyl-CoA reductase/sulfur reductase-like enzyme